MPLLRRWRHRYTNMAAPMARFVGPLRFCQRVYLRPSWREQQYSSESSSQDNDDKNKNHDEKQKAALEKLNSLLTSMKAVPSEAPQQSVSKSLGLNLAKPTKYIRKEQITTTTTTNEQIKKENDDDSESSDSDLEPEIVSAVKDVASSLGGDVKKTEIELLKKLTDPILPSKEKKDLESQAHKINISDIFLGMKIDRSKPRAEAGQVIPPSEVNGSQSRFARDVGREGLSTKMRSEISPVRRTRIDLFGSGKLDIFQKETTEQTKDVPHLNTWEKLDNREYQLLVTHPPINAFEEMILWTEQGKLWKFPINNEEGLEEEQKVPFYEHVFLEPLLEEGFPTRGPIRHFMELVVTGLSKNPYLTVKQKHEHIDWFRQYFQKKSKILKEVGALA